MTAFLNFPGRRNVSPTYLPKLRFRMSGTYVYGEFRGMAAAANGGQMIEARFDQDKISNARLRG